MAELNIEAIRDLMTKYDMNESELARRVGVTRSAVNRILKGDRKPSFKFMAGLKDAFPRKSLDNFFIPTVSPKSVTKKSKKKVV